MDKSEIIVSAEEQFAREVTIGVIYLRPLSVWHYLIPGMFIIDFLRRGSAIRKYTETFMFPRRLALQASHLEDATNKWLASFRLNSPELVKAQKGAVDLLTEHYVNLLKAAGDSYYDLIRNAYPSRQSFETHLRRLTAAEDEVDRAILAVVGDNQKVKEKLQREAQQVEKRRQKVLEDIF
jgi:hypothetical protein